MLILLYGRLKWKNKHIRVAFIVWIINQPNILVLLGGECLSLARVMGLLFAISFIQVTLWYNFGINIEQVIKSKADMTYEEFIEIIADLVAKDDENRFQRNELERELREGKRNTIANEMLGLCQIGINNACQVVDVCRKYLQESKHLA